MNKKYFSLIELMIVIAIIGILVAVLLPHLNDMITEANRSQAEQSLKSIRDAVIRYNASNSEDCQDLQWLVPKYIAELKPDPWGNPYYVDSSSGLVFSAGPDEISGDSTNIFERDDNINVWFKPQLMLEDAVYSDNNNNGFFDDGDSITVVFTKSARRADDSGAMLPDPSDFTLYKEPDAAALNTGIDMASADFIYTAQNAMAPGDTTTEFSKSKYKITCEISGGYTPNSPWQPYTDDFKQLYINCSDNNLFEDAARYRSIKTAHHVTIRRAVKK